MYVRSFLFLFLWSLCGFLFTTGIGVLAFCGDPVLFLGDDCYEPFASSWASFIGVSSFCFVGEVSREALGATANDSLACFPSFYC
jgi:hypothetical protein